MKNTYKAKPDLEVAKNIYKTKIDGLFFLRFKKYSDDRGFFSELAKIPPIEKLIGFKFEPQQFNYSFSKTNVVRGLHAENWHKLVTVVCGQAFSALVDIRPHSPTFKQVEYFRLGTHHDEDYGSGLFISPGIANSICVVEGPVGYIYAVNKLYEERDRSGDKAISLFDPDLNIDWPIKKENMIVSKRDMDAVSLKGLFEG